MGGYNAITNFRNESLYLIGGKMFTRSMAYEIELNFVTTVERYDIASGSWSTSAELNLPRVGNPSSVAGDYIYAFCGPYHHDW